MNKNPRLVFDMGVIVWCHGLMQILLFFKFQKLMIAIASMDRNFFFFFEPMNEGWVPLT